MFLRVEVLPDAKKETLKKEDGKWHISVKEPAEQNRANTRVRQIIADELSVPLGKVRILTGHHSRVKMVSVNN